MTASQPSVLFVTSHFHAPGWRKTGIHLMAYSLARRGWPVAIVTVGQSFAKRMLDPRIAELAAASACNPSPVQGLVAREFVHPASGRNQLISLVTSPILWRYGRNLDGAFRRLAQKASYIIIEAGYPLFYATALRKAAPSSKIAALVNDDLSLIGFRREVVEMAGEVLPRLDMVRTNARALLAKLPPGTRGVFIPSGIDKANFAVAVASPYADNTINAICLGNMLFDEAAVLLMARSRPDIAFHLIGVRLACARPANLRVLDELPFPDTIPYIVHADVGLAPYRAVPGIGYLAQSSLKLLQYAYCGLPTLVPAAAAPSGAHVFSYDATRPESALLALDQALAAGRQHPEASVLDWGEVADRIIAAMDDPPPRLWP